MTSFLSSPRLRWTAPAVVAAAIAAAALTTQVAANASGQPKLTPRTAAELLAAVEQASPPGLSGTVVETTKLGLPSLPDIGGTGADSDLSLQNLVTGSHTIRVWDAGRDKQRLALLGQLSESDIVRDGSDVWTYSSTSHRVTHSTLTDPTDPTGTADEAAGALTPQSAAQQALAAIDPTTTVQVDSTARVAGRPAYQLSLLPKDTRSLIGSVQIAIDSETSVPLRVQVFAKGASSPAIDVGFTDVSFAVPSASVFHFVPPAGTTVTQSTLPFGSDAPARATATAGADVNRARSGTSSSKVLGTGWTSVVELSQSAADTATGDAQGTDPDGVDSNSSVSQLLRAASTPVDGGRLISTALLSVLITDDGRIFAGPVSPAAIEQVATTGRGL